MPPSLTLGRSPSQGESVVSQQTTGSHRFSACSTDATLPLTTYEPLSQISQFGLSALKHINAARHIKERLRAALSPR